MTIKLCVALILPFYAQFLKIIYNDVNRMETKSVYHSSRQDLWIPTQRFFPTISYKILFLAFFWLFIFLSPLKVWNFASHLQNYWYKVVFQKQSTKTFECFNSIF